MDVCPKDCPNRRIGCHDQCVPYAAFKAKREAYNRTIREGYAVESTAFAMSHGMRAKRK